jgi:hypothetical protein
MGEHIGGGDQLFYMTDPLGGPEIGGEALLITVDGMEQQ